METNKVIEQHKKKAQKLIDKVQRKITSKGGYENAGIKEIHDFYNALPYSLSYKERGDLMDFIHAGMDNLKY